MTTVASKRCSKCGFRVRSADHNKGDNHLGRIIKIGGKAISLGPRKRREVKTAPKSKGAGFDFSLVKTGGRR